MAYNGGRGRVQEKNKEIMGDDIVFGEMTAVKHANGVDWWIVTPKRNSNTWYKFLFTKDGIVDTLEQTIGTLPRPQAEGGIQLCFSPNGSKLFRTNPQEAIKVYDFDRTTGEFIGFDTITTNYFNYPEPVTTYCAVSPSGRFLYITTALYVFQFDLYANNISASQKIVAEWDGFQEPTGTTFGMMQLGPDCKIYILTIDSKYYHVIHHPDEEGVACDVEQRGVVFPATSGSSMPSFPNYRLGPIDNPGLPCSPVVATQGPVVWDGPEVWVLPNPAQDEITIWKDANLPTVVWNLYDLSGRLVLQKHITSNQVIIPLYDLIPSIYVWQSTYEGQIFATGKVVNM